MSNAGAAYRKARFFFQGSWTLRLCNLLKWAGWWMIMSLRTLFRSQWWMALRISIWRTVKNGLSKWEPSITGILHIFIASMCSDWFSYVQVVDLFWDWRKVQTSFPLPFQFYLLGFCRRSNKDVIFKVEILLEILEMLEVSTTLLVRVKLSLSFSRLISWVRLDVFEKATLNAHNE